MQSSTEQTRHGMWTRRRFDARHRIPSLTGVAAYSDSWEERAFAVDSSGRLGGCVWPPRCYSCSFCRREFRSAQALGGHMNVHRRDRARLKQSSPPGLGREDDLLITCTSGHLLPQQRQLYTHLCSPTEACSPNPTHDGVASASASPLSPCKFLSLVAPSTQENCTQQYSTILASSSCSSSTNQTHHQLKRSFLHTHAGLELGGEMNSRIGDVGREITEQKSENKVEDNISIGGRCKKQRSIDVAPSFLGQGLDQGGRLHHHHHLKPAGVLVLDDVTVEELDLELRLGDRPKIC